jgi:hypothetical protein
MSLAGADVGADFSRFDSLKNTSGVKTPEAARFRHG